MKLTNYLNILILLKNILEKQLKWKIFIPTLPHLNSLIKKRKLWKTETLILH